MRVRRREFIKRMTTGAAAAYLMPGMVYGAPQVRPAAAKSRVVRTKRSGLVDSSEKIDPRVVRTTVDETIVALTGVASARDAWERLFPRLQTTEVVGIKVNMLNRNGLVSHPQVVYTVAESLSESLGFDPNNIIIWDRSDEEMARFGYTINRSNKGVRCFGTSAGRSGRGEGDIGYDPAAAIDIGGGRQVHLTRIMSEVCDYLINVPIMKDHRIAGVTLSMKNHYGTIDSPNACHGNHGDPYIAQINSHPVIREKTRLILCDAVFGCYDGGPGAPPQWMGAELIASTDPVALDSIGLEIIEGQRRDRRLAPVAPSATAIATAARLGLGQNDPEQIEVVQA